MSIEKIESKELIKRFVENFSNSISFSIIQKDNPCRIYFKGIQMYVYIKNLSPAQLSNVNPDIWRIQLPIKYVFYAIKKSSIPFILLGYDAQNDVYTAWNPHWAKQRLNVGKSVSFYSRLSIQIKAHQTQDFQEQQLNNNGKVVAFPRTFIRKFLSKIDDFFPDKSDYVAIGSRKRTNANETYKSFINYLSNMHEFACYLANIGFDEETINNYCQAIHLLMDHGYVSNNRKVFLACDSITEYPNVVNTFFNIQEVNEQNKLLNNTLSVALKEYIQFLIEYTPLADNLEGAIIEENVLDDNKKIFDFFCNNDNILRFKSFLETQQISVRNSFLYMQAVDYLFENGYIERYADIFLEYRTIEQYYRRASNRFFSIPEMKSLNNKNKSLYSTALNYYIKSLLDYLSKQFSVEEPEIKEEISILGNNDNKDWETPYINEMGKLTHIANPKVIDELRPLLDTEYPSVAAAFNVIDKHYQNRFPNMTFGDWNTLMNNINWQEPYAIFAEDTESQKYEGKQKTHILKVTTPEGYVYEDRKVSETLVKIIKYAGANAVRNLNINICGTNMIVEEDEINSKYEVATKYVGDGLYVNTISSTQKKYQIIKQISDDLGLDLKVEYVSINDGNSELVTYPVTGSTRQKIKVTFPDGKIIQHNVVLDTLIEVIRYAKPEMVRKLKIINCAENLILKYHEINPRYIKPTKQLDDTYYVNTCSDTNTKYMQIKEISDRLHLNLIVELV